MKYRADIDGLRGVSILFVLLFHLDIAYFSGGFIGVDIFFVISGFVITKNIVSKLSNNSFDLLHFYYKRIRRLLPALFVTLFVSAFIAYLLMSPPDLVRFGGALASSAFSVSNFYFWQEASYFDPSIEIKPLLHTWSLSVEEQFYLFWPLLIIFLTKLNPWQKVVVFLTLILLSLFISVFLGTHSVEAGFYLLPSRVLEFALGASIALWGKSIVKGIVGNVLALTGFFMIFFSAIAFNNEMIYPSYYALLPAIGASLIILSSGGFLGWFLTN